MSAPGFRQMGFDDLGRVMEIEQDIYEFPWSYGNFADSIASGYSCIVMENSGFFAQLLVAEFRDVGFQLVDFLDCHAILLEQAIVTTTENTF